MTFFNPVKIELFDGCRESIHHEIKGQQVLIFCSFSSLKRYKKDKLLNSLIKMENIIFEHQFETNPSLEDMKKISYKYSKHNIDSIIGIGGGSAMDVAKISNISINAYKKEISLDQLLKDQSLINKIDPIPLYLIPTTAGTGSEVTPFATVWDYDSGIKKSLANEKMFATKSYIDPDFLIDIPFDYAFSTCLDALNQALESIWNKNANDYTNSLAINAVTKSLSALQKLDEINTNKSLRKELVTASLFAGVAISQTRTALCHSISYPITINFGVPHGFACAFSMLAVLDHNSSKIKNEIRYIETHIGDEVSSVIKKIFKKYNYYSYIKKYIKSQDSMLAISDQMISPGRADNNICQINNKNLTEIIKKSCKDASLL